MRALHSYAVSSLMIAKRCEEEEECNVWKYHRKHEIHDSYHEICHDHIHALESFIMKLWYNP